VLREKAIEESKGLETEINNLAYDLNVFDERDE
jgi:hypothetical protein